ncbi:hypothetical protein [Rubrolithibacter danxiaensis]|uniref:hypothetical protein n=1 Tax=Rubrolithibacter danxiaensis TaxID=3390805 RepID=UPI003BF86FEE
MKLVTVKYSYQDFMHLAIYADLSTSLKRNDRILTSRDAEYEEVTELLKENNIGFDCKSKREIMIVPEKQA